MDFLSHLGVSLPKGRRAPYTDTQRARGVTALQLHAGGPFTLRVRVVELEVLP